MAKKKRKPLLSFTKNKLLHSKNNTNHGKSTYFYSVWTPFCKKVSNLQKHLVKFCPEKCDFPNKTVFGMVSNLSYNKHSDNVTNNKVVTKPSFWGHKTRSSLAFKNPYSKNAYGRLGFLKSYILPVFCSMALLLVLGCMVSPVTSGGEEVHAAYEPVTSTSGVSLLMETNDALAQETQASNGVTAYRYNRFKVNKGSDIDKYQVLVQAANGYDSNLVGAENGQVVNAVSGTVKGNAIDSAWGYSLAEGAITSEATLANLDYQALPGSGSTNTSATPYTETKEFTLAFAANIKDKPADHYQTNVLLSVAAGAYQIATELGFNGITEMQQMTSSVCNSAPTGLEGRLKDTRDNKVYWIAKLKDNNCWMTQNLDLDLSTGTALTSTKSDIPEGINWTPGYNTENDPSTISGWGNSPSAQKSYDPGNYYYTTPSIQNQCTNNNIGISSCTSKGWKTNIQNSDISGMKWLNLDDSWTPVYDTYFISASSYTGTDGRSICNKEVGSWLGNSSYTQCKTYYYLYPKLYEHYHAGNYYSYQAAIANSVPNASGEVAGSICPNGWQLPTSDSTTADKSFGRLVGQYGLLSKVTNGDNDIRLSPLYFVYGGWLSGSSLEYTGYRGYYWSSKTSSDTNAYYLSFGTSVAVSGNGHRFYGQSVRCVAR